MNQSFKAWLLIILFATFPAAPCSAQDVGSLLNHLKVTTNTVRKQFGVPTNQVEASKDIPSSSKTASSQPTTYSHPRISPFGPLKWDDSLTTVIKKLASYPGIKVVKLGGEATQIALHGQLRVHNSTGILDVTHVPSSDRIADFLSRAVSKTAANAAYKSNDEVQTSGLDVSQYIGPDKKPARYIASGGEDPLVQIGASPINIANTLYIITVEFDNEPGLALYKPDNVLYSSNKNLYWPLVMTSVHLQPIYNLTDEQRKRVWGAVQPKYARFPNSLQGYGLDYQTDAWVTDSFKGAFRVYVPELASSNNNLYFEYRSNFLPSKLYQLYKKYQSRWATNAIKKSGVKDSSSSL